MVATVSPDQSLTPVLLNRFSLVAHLERSDARASSLLPQAMSSTEARGLVILARERQQARLRSEGLDINAEVSPGVLPRHLNLSDGCERRVSEVRHRGTLSMHGIYRMLCVARTAADLDGSENVQERHVSLALSFAPTNRRPTLHA
jgi:magnesium chelatase family protein